MFENQETGQIQKLQFYVLSVSDLQKKKCLRKNISSACKINEGDCDPFKK